MEFWNCPGDVLGLQGVSELFPTGKQNTGNPQCGGCHTYAHLGLLRMNCLFVPAGSAEIHRLESNLIYPWPFLSPNLTLGHQELTNINIFQIFNNPYKLSYNHPNNWYRFIWRKAERLRISIHDLILGSKVKRGLKWFHHKWKFGPSSCHMAPSSHGVHPYVIPVGSNYNRHSWLQVESLHQPPGQQSGKLLGRKTKWKMIELLHQNTKLWKYYIQEIRTTF